MKSFGIGLSVVALFLCSCGERSEPASLAGENQAPEVALSFLRALQAGELEEAQSLLYQRPDHILQDLPACRELFFGVNATAITLLGSGRELYGRDWHIYVDVKINYGPQMKQLRLHLTEGEPPRLRGVNPLRD